MDTIELPNGDLLFVDLHGQAIYQGPRHTETRLSDEELDELEE